MVYPHEDSMTAHGKSDIEYGQSFSLREVLRLHKTKEMNLTVLWIKNKEFKPFS
jgi:hypothetical protein